MNTTDIIYVKDIKEYYFIALLKQTVLLLCLMSSTHIRYKPQSLFYYDNNCR